MVSLVTGGLAPGDDDAHATRTSAEMTSGTERPECDGELMPAGGCIGCALIHARTQDVISYRCLGSADER